MIQSRRLTRQRQAAAWSRFGFIPQPTGAPSLDAAFAGKSSSERLSYAAFRYI